MLKTYQKKVKENFDLKYPDSYHCHFALKDLLINLININYLGITNFYKNSSNMIIKIDRTYYFRLPLPVTDTYIKKFSASIEKFTIASESLLCEVLLKNTSLSKLKEDHCTRCPQISVCKAFRMSPPVETS